MGWSHPVIAVEVLMNCNMLLSAVASIVFLPVERIAGQNVLRGWREVEHVGGFDRVSWVGVRPV